MAALKENDKLRMIQCDLMVQFISLAKNSKKLSITYHVVCKLAQEGSTFCLIRNKEIRQRIKQYAEVVKISQIWSHWLQCQSSTKPDATEAKF